MTAYNRERQSPETCVRAWRLGVRKATEAIKQEIKKTSDVRVVLTNGAIRQRSSIAAE